jgi:hypothetical protein
LGLFFKQGDDEAVKRKYLKQIAKELAKGRFKFLKSASDEILPAFPKFLFDIYKAIYPTQLVFQNTQNPNVWKMLAINSVIDEKTDKISEALSEAAITDAANTMEVNELREKVKADLETFLAVFDADMCEFVDGLYAKIQQFKDFCCFDFYQVLKKFDHGICEGDLSYTPKFNSLNGEYALDSIKDFMEAAWPLLELDDWTPMFNVLTTRSADIISPNTWAKTLSRLQAVKDSNILEMMIQLITKDPYYQFEQSGSQEKIIASYLEKTKDEVDKTIQKIIVSQKLDKIDSLASQIFGNEVELPLRNYTETGSQPLERKKLGKFEFCQPLSFLKLFLLEYAKTGIKEFSDVTLIRGKWLNHSLAAPMSDSFHVLLELSDKVVEFDDSLDENGITGNKIRTLIPRVDRDRGAHDIVKNIVKETNSQAKKLITMGAQELIVIAKYIKLLLEDHSKPQSELLTNWKELEHYTSVPLKQLGTDMYKKIYLFVQLVQAYFN